MDMGHWHLHLHHLHRLDHCLHHLQDSPAILIDQTSSWQPSRLRGQYRHGSQVVFVANIVVGSQVVFVAHIVIGSQVVFVANIVVGTNSSSQTVFSLVPFTGS